MNLPHPTVAMGTTLLLACNAGLAASSRSKVERGAHESRSIPVSERPSIESLQRDLDVIYDVRHLALASEQLKPHGFVGLLPPDADLSSLQPARVVGYVIGAAWAWKVTPDSETAGCPGAIAADGRLCPEVLLPGRGLDEAQLQRLLRIATEPQTELASPCSDDGWPLHAWVFYDANDAPRAQVIVNLPCGRWSRSLARLSSVQREDLLELCQQAGLPGCHANATPAERGRYSGALGHWMDERAEPGLLPNLARPNPLRAVPTGIDERTPIAELSPTNKRLLCQWNLQYSVWYTHAGSGYGIDDGHRRSVKVQSWQQCIERFPSCAASLSEVLPCMRWAQRGDPWFLTPDARSCQELIACRWGYEIGDE